MTVIPAKAGIQRGQIGMLSTVARLFSVTNHEE